FTVYARLCGPSNATPPSVARALRAPRFASSSASAASSPRGHVAKNCSACVARCAEPEWSAAGFCRRGSLERLDDDKYHHQKKDRSRRNLVDPPGEHMQT